MRKKWFVQLQTIVVTVILGLGFISQVRAAVGVGQKAPEFSLIDIQGQRQALEQNKGASMTVLYFFDAASQASQDGLLMLDQLYRKHNEQHLNIWGITKSSQSDVTAFANKASLQYPLLLDNGDVSQSYEARLILPVICVLGPDLVIMDYFQGGGKGAENMLVSLAKSQLHRHQPQFAEILGETVSSKNPKNIEAKAVQGHAALKQGHLEKAEKIFMQISTAQEGGRLVAKEGQAAVLAMQGRTDQALALADEVVQKAPQRGLAQKIKGDLLSTKGDKQAAVSAYVQAAQNSAADQFVQAEAYNQLGRLYTQQGKYDLARIQFDHAVELDPYYLEPTSNKGLTYEKEGQWSKALQLYQKAISLNQADVIAAVLAEKAEKMIAIQKDEHRRVQLDHLISDLVQRYKKQKQQMSTQSEDQWTSRPMVLTFIDIKESGGLTARDGLAVVIATRLGELLNASGRVEVVERAIIEQLLSELKLGTSELADPNTGLRLGKILAAKLIGTGTIIYMPGGTLLNFRFIDTETTAVANTITRHLAPNADIKRALYALNRQILEDVIKNYPLRGFVVQVNGEEVMLNIGNKQGVTLGSAFEVVEEGEPVTYKGKILRSSLKSIGRLEVIRVEPDLCFARVLEIKRPLRQDDKVKEVISVLVKDTSHAN